MDREKVEKTIERHRLEESIRGEFEATVGMRVDRYLQVKPHGFVPNTHFSAPLAQCSLLYRDGHYYGCIALAQAVAESLIKYIKEVVQGVQFLREKRGYAGYTGFYGGRSQRGALSDMEEQGRLPPLEP